LYPAGVLYCLSDVLALSGCRLRSFVQEASIHTVPASTHPMNDKR
jgi:hypothetical protein